MGRKGSSSHRFSAFTVVCQRRRHNRKKYRNFTCLSPWSIISCMFSLRKTKGEKNVDFRHSQDDVAKFGAIMERMHGGSSSSQEVSGPSGHGKEVSFNLGVGFGLIFLMAASKCELKKMVDLCKQMETLVQDFKMQLQNQQRYTPFEPSESNVTITTLVEAQDQTHNNVSPYSLERKNSDAASSCDQHSCYSIVTIAKDTKMDQLEAELEVELEHLQVQLDSEVTINCECTEIVVEDSAPEESITTLSFEQVFEPSETITHMENYDGVSPMELERRLHELLAMRQEERIKALESALECAMQKLHEKERELSWWKDTAKLAFQKIPRHGYPASCP